ncbi:partial Putative NAD(P)H nitroreductase, partial [Anaerolineae bacterium]
MMDKPESRPMLSRRDFLKLLTVGGVTVTGGYLLSEYAPWLDFNQQADQIWRPFDMASTIPAQMRELVHYATLAANGHNTQPWKFAIKENAIEIHPDYTRRLPVVDPSNRELWISLGCALENLLIATCASGFAPEVSYPDTTDFINVRLTTDTPQSNPLFDTIPNRQNTRSEYDGQPVKNVEMDQLQALSLEPGVSLRFITTPTDLKTVLEYVNQGNLSQYADKAFIDELIYWLRFNKKESLASLDGLYSVCSG